MRINRHELARLSIQERRDLTQRIQQADPGEAGAVVAEVIAAVRERGDAAVIEYTRRFDDVELERLRVQPEDFDAAEGALDADLKEAIDYAVANIRSHHEQQKPDKCGQSEGTP